MGQDFDRAMTPFSWSNPYAWPRKPLLAQNVVSTSQPLAAQAGPADARRRRQRGGRGARHRDRAHDRRADLERHRVGSLRASSGTGSSCTASTRRAARRPRGRRSTSPARRRCRSAAGTRSVPGCVSAWVELSERYGRLPFEKLFERRSLRAATATSSRRSSRSAGRCRCASSRRSPASPRRSCPAAARRAPASGSGCARRRRRSS